MREASQNSTSASVASASARTVPLELSRSIPPSTFGPTSKPDRDEDDRRCDRRPRQPPRNRRDAEQRERHDGKGPLHRPARAYELSRSGPSSQPGDARARSAPEDRRHDAVRARSMNPKRARLLAEWAHRTQPQPTGEPLIAHVRRVAAATPQFARAVAWLHDTLEWTSVSEEELLSNGLSEEELRAVRLLTRGRPGVRRGLPRTHRPDRPRAWTGGRSRARGQGRRIYETGCSIPILERTVSACHTNRRSRCCSIGRRM